MSKRDFLKKYKKIVDKYKMKCYHVKVAVAKKKYMNLFMKIKLKKNEKNS